MLKIGINAYIGILVSIVMRLGLYGVLVAGMLAGSGCGKKHDERAVLPRPYLLRHNNHLDVHEVQNQSGIGVYDPSDRKERINYSYNILKSEKKSVNGVVGHFITTDDPYILREGDVAVHEKRELIWVLSSDIEEKVILTLHDFDNDQRVDMVSYDRMCSREISDRFPEIFFEKEHSKKDELRVLDAATILYQRIRTDAWYNMEKEKD